MILDSPYHRLLLVLLLFAVHLISAQDFSIPPGWQNNASSLNYTERQEIAWGAAQELTNHVDTTKGFPSDVASTGDPLIITVSNMVIVLANQDRHSGNGSWMHPFVDNILHSNQSALNDTSDNESNALLGLAEISAYLAYNDSTSLEAAKNKFDVISTDFLTASAAKSGKYPRAFNTTCGEKLGGVLFTVCARSDASLP